MQTEACRGRADRRPNLLVRFHVRQCLIFKTPFRLLSKVSICLPSKVSSLTFVLYSTILSANPDFVLGPSFGPYTILAPFLSLNPSYPPHQNMATSRLTKNFCTYGVSTGFAYERVILDLESITVQYYIHVAELSRPNTQSTSLFSHSADPIHVPDTAYTYTRRHC